MESVKSSRFILLMACFCGLWACSQALENGVRAESLVTNVKARERSVMTLIGASSRTFRNRFKRSMRASSSQCLLFHSAGDWWHYEWCIDRFVRQFHVNEPYQVSNPRQFHTLGRFKAVVSSELQVYEASNLSKLPHPSYTGYYICQLYASGDLCGADDLHDAGYASGGFRNRSVEIRYTCCAFRANETYIESVLEQLTCQYELTVCTPVACGVMQKESKRARSDSSSMGESERLDLLDKVKGMFYHAYEGYMQHAFPQDQLNPISCRGETFELGKMQLLTLIDTLDTLAVLEDAPRFQHAVKMVLDRANFNLDTEVSVFETTIRVLGGLLSAHLFASDAKLALFPPGDYSGGLLHLAIDLADRLLPAFMTDTGIPYGTVNLRKGVPFGETKIASTAGAGSLTMEFTMLSVLTGDAKYANVSRRAVRALYERRSRVGLVGKHIDTSTGEWSETISGPGSNSDSFYEYLMKMYMTFGDDESYDMLQDIYHGVMTHNLYGDWFADVSMWSGCPHSARITFENLACFWPGMQVAMGHLAPATSLLNAFYRVWREFGFVPEQFNVMKWKPQRGHGARYPLRPELIESTFFMHDATKDSSWLRAGQQFVASLDTYARTSCGYASIADVETKQQEDSMPSFFLSETCKYLVLLFNTSHFIRDGGYVFTTEAHPFPLLPSNKTRAVLFPTTPPRVGPIDAQVDRLSSHWQRRQCDALPFGHPFVYDVTYSAQMEETKPRCDPANAYDNLHKKQPSGAASSSERELDQFVDVSDELLTQQLHELLPQLQARFKQKWTRTNDVDTESSDAFATTPGSGAFDPNEFRGRMETRHPQLGAFDIEQPDGLLRITRKETKESIEMMSVTDSLQIVTFGIRRQFDPVTDDLIPVSFKSRRFLVSSHRRLPSTLYVVHQHRPNAKDVVQDIQRVCSLRFRQQHTRKEFLIGCVAANFGFFALQPDDFFELNHRPIEFAEPLDGCRPLTNPQLAGKLVVVTRGTCFFETKARFALARRVAGLIVINNDEQDENAVMIMSGAQGTQEELESELDGEPGNAFLSIPIVMVARAAMPLLEHLLRPKTKHLVVTELLYEVHESGTTFPVVTGDFERFKAFGEEWGFQLVLLQEPNNFSVQIMATPSHFHHRLTSSSTSRDLQVPEQAKDQEEALAAAAAEEAETKVETEKDVEKEEHGDTDETCPVPDAYQVLTADKG